MAMTEDQVIDTAMMLIVNSGDARSLAFRALEAAKQGNYEEAHKLMKDSNEKSLEAHRQQTDLLADEGNGDGPKVTLLLVHAQDHLMTSILAQELITELIDLHEKKADKA
ncbi:PTS lactose/cellobiose transporter subunit IIA [Gemmiger sp.]